MNTITDIAITEKALAATGATIPIFRGSPGQPMELIGHACARCRASYLGEDTESAARVCCAEVTYCEGCGNPKKIRGYRFCSACARAEDERAEERAFAKAEKETVIADEAPLDTLVFRDGYGHEGYLTLGDAIAQNLTYVWACDAEKARFHLEEELHEYLGTLYESAEDWVDWSKVREAQVLIDAALADVTSYQESERVLLLPAYCRICHAV